jgi:outer membrane protein assembly factor BamE
MNGDLPADGEDGRQCIIGARDTPSSAGPRMPKITRRTLRTTLLVFAVAVATAGCGVIYRQPIYQGNLLDKSAIDQLQAGMTKQDVMALLGTPSITDSFNQNRWDYTATQRINRRGTTEVKNFTVFFENGAVTRWEGDYFPEQDDTLAQNARRQFGPNLAKDDKKRRR